MKNLLIVVDDIKHWKPYFPSNNVVAVADYLFGPAAHAPPHTQVINLCCKYKYLSIGYYCSLLAEARKHHVVPSVRTISDLSRKSIYLDVSSSSFNKIMEKFNKHTDNATQNKIVVDVFFGKTQHPELQDLARQAFETFTCPLLAVELRSNLGSWRIWSIAVQELASFTPEQEDLFAMALDEFSGKVWRKPRQRKQYRYDLAILHNPHENMPPSNKVALNQFVRIGAKYGYCVELIEKKDYTRLAEYDALLIRETTEVTNHTYRFAKKAESEGMIVIDDPNSILRCTNKIYLANLLTAHKIPRPNTIICHKDNLKQLEQLDDLGYPIVLKIPDGAFSRGVTKVQSRTELALKLKELLKQSALILAQEYLYTAYDWRVVILNNQPLLACQYFMSSGHWQVVEHQGNGRFKEGSFTTHLVHTVPPAILKVALSAAALIGDGLYGVDLKETERGPVVIEINDNPNLDAGIEDVCLKDNLYKAIFDEFTRRLALR